MRIPAWREAVVTRRGQPAPPEQWRPDVDVSHGRAPAKCERRQSGAVLRELIDRCVRLATIGIARTKMGARWRRCDSDGCVTWQVRKPRLIAMAKLRASNRRPGKCASSRGQAQRLELPRHAPVAGTEPHPRVGRGGFSSVLLRIFGLCKYLVWNGLLE